MNRIIKISLKLFLAGIVAFALIIILCNVWVVKSTKEKLYTDLSLIPSNDVALLLGTSKFSREGNENIFFKNRIDAATELYYSKKIKHIIVSGDNSLSYYNEPKDMKNALILRGIPDTVITLDYAGFRTFDSVVRSKKVFNQNKITIITQEFHAYRALFISNYYNMDAIAFAADRVTHKYAMMTVYRENFARCRAILDLYILKERPKFLGEKIGIKI